MTLDDYLHTHRIRLKDFSALTGISYSRLHGYRSGRRNPELATAIKIEDATGGKVTVRELLVVSE